MRAKLVTMMVFVLLLFSQRAIAQTSPETLSAESHFEAKVEIDYEQSPNGRTCASNPVRNMWFYKPPTTVPVQTVIDNFDIFVLTRDDEQMLSQATPKGQVFQYIKFDAVSDGCFQASLPVGTPCSCDIKTRSNQVGWLQTDICDIRDNHPDWFLRDGSGNLIYKNEFVMMDPGNQGWREFWLARIQQYQAQYPEWDGVFMDNMSTRFGRHGDETEIVLQNYPTEQSYQDAVMGFVNYGQVNYFKPTNRIMYANLSVRWGHHEPFVNYMQVLDGVMDEFWAVSRTDVYTVKAWEARLLRAQHALVSDRSMMLVTQGPETDVNRQLFGLASYLLVAGEKIYFRYTSDQSGYSQAWLYSNYQAQLGAPVGYYTQSENKWERQFTNGKVVVNPETQTAKIKIYRPCG